jgi:hypothetical protein
MTTLCAAETTRPQPHSPRTDAPPPRDVSITDYSWVAGPHIFGRRLLVQTPRSCLKGASNPHVC